MELLCLLVKIVCPSVVRVSLMYVSRPLKLCLLGGRPKLKQRYSIWRNSGFSR